MDTTEPAPEQMQAPAPRPAAPYRAEKLASYVLRFVNRLKTSGRSTHTLSAYRNDLSLFAEFLLEKGFDPRSFQVNLKEEWEHYLKSHGRNSAASVRRALMSVRTFLHFLVAERIVESSPLLEVKSPRQPTHDLLRCQPAQFRTLVTTLSARCQEGDEKAPRDLALVQILGACGLKATEAALLTWDDVFMGAAGEGGNLRVPGGNGRLVPFDRTVHEALDVLRSLRSRLGLDASGKARLLFGYLNVGRRDCTDSLHRHGIKFVVYEVCEEILGIPYNSESLRNHAILRWLDQGLSVQQVADLAGYSSLHSLERFARESKGTRGARRKHRHAATAEEGAVKTARAPRKATEGT